MREPSTGSAKSLTCTFIPACLAQACDLIATATETPTSSLSKPPRLAILRRHAILPACPQSKPAVHHLYMNEIQKFLVDKSVKPYGVGMMSPDDAIAFINLCMKTKMPIYGIDGFHRRIDKSPAAIQIDQGFSTNYSNVTMEEAYKLALDFLEEKRGDDTMLFQVIYEHVTPDYDIVRNYLTPL